MQGGKKLDFTEINQCKQILLGLSLAGNLVLFIFSDIFHCCTNIHIVEFLKIHMYFVFTLCMFILVFYRLLNIH